MSSSLSLDNIIVGDKINRTYNKPTIHTNLTHNKNETAQLTMISREEESNDPIESKVKGHNDLNALAMAAAAVSREPSSSASASDFNKKRVRRGESFCRMGVDRSISNSLKSPSTQKLKTKQKHVTFSEQTPLFWECSNFEPNCSEEEYEERKNELWYSVSLTLSYFSTYSLKVVI